MYLNSQSRPPLPGAVHKNNELKLLLEEHLFIKHSRENIKKFVKKNLVKLQKHEDKNPTLMHLQKGSHSTLGLTQHVECR